MGRKKKDPKQTAPVAPQVTTDKPEQTNRETRYVVVRDGHRVSSQEYSSTDDAKAQEELNFWRLVERKHSWGAPVELVQYDNRLHRVFVVN